MENQTYSRYAALGKDFDDYWNHALHSKNQKYFSQMELIDFVKLKKAISNINNIVTLLVTDRFIDYLLHCKIVSLTSATNMHEEVNATHANTNGFDIESIEAKIVAEVKCNIPVSTSAFGAAQEESIIDDIVHLYMGKSKSKVKAEELEEYYKFMVLLDGDNVLECTQKIINKVNDKKLLESGKVKLYCPGEKLLKNVVYVVLVNPK